MNNENNQKVMIITGTSRGIGNKLALYFIKKKFIVCGCSRKDSKIKHENYRHFILDVSNEELVVKMIKSVVNEFKRIDVLLNNAGIASMNHILTTPYSAIQNIFNTNVFGSFLFLREVSKVMGIQFNRAKRLKNTKNCNFRIINFATIATPLRLEGEAAYAASKASIINLTQIAAKELAPFNITINAIAPTPIQTDLIRFIPKEKIKALLEKQAIKRLANIKDIINVINFFINKNSNFITGQVVYLGGVNE